MKKGCDGGVFLTKGRYGGEGKKRENEVDFQSIDRERTRGRKRKKGKVRRVGKGVRKRYQQGC